MSKMKRIIITCLIAVLACSFLFACGNKNQATETVSQTQITSLDDLPGKTLAILTGSIYDTKARELLPESKRDYYGSSPDCFLAVSEGKADAIVVSVQFFESAKETYPNLINIGKLADADLFYATSMTDFGDKLSTELDRYLKREWQSGNQQKLIDKWKNNTGEVKAIDFSSLTAENGTIKAAVEPLDLPYACNVEGGYAGIEAENLYNFCKEYGYGIDLQTLEWSSILSGVTTGQIDLTMYTYYSDERAEKINFAGPYEYSQVIVVAKDESYNEGAMRSGFINDLANSFNKTFIRESRWKLLAQGLLTTLEIVVLSAIFGTLLGAILCWLRLSKSDALSKIIGIFIRIMQGVPIVVLLLVLYYVIFAKSGMAAIAVGVVGFSLDFGVYVCEILRAGINSIDKGQWEASESLGMSRFKTLIKVILPQAICNALPVYKGQFISMVKMTSVVGYIAVMDITKASDIIRTRTYEAFFPLIITALIYFAIAWVFTTLLGRIEFNLDPKKKKRALVGIDTGVEIPDYDPQPETFRKSDVVIELKHLRKEYEKSTPLKDVNAQIRRGDVVAVIGPSGTGKSTLLRCINRLETPTSGEVYAFGELMSDNEKELCKQRARIGMVFQSFNLFNHLNIIENVMLAPVTLKKMTKQEAYERGIALLRKVGLAERAMQFPSQLSGGQKQRVAIVRALAMDPEVMLFDEPTSALDPTMIGEVLRVISGMAKKGMTMMIVTHEMKFARDVSNRAIYLDQGEIFEEGSSDQIFVYPQKERTKAFINHLKLFSFDINSRDFDYLELLTSLSRFGHSEYMTRQQINCLELVAEELIVEGLLKSRTAEFPARLIVEYADSGKISMYLRFGGRETDILYKMDKVSHDIVGSKARSIKQTWSEDNGNEVIIEI